MIGIKAQQLVQKGVESVEKQNLEKPETKTKGMELENGSVERFEQAMQGPENASEATKTAAAQQAQAPERTQSTMGSRILESMSKAGSDYNRDVESVNKIFEKDKLDIKDMMQAQQKISHITMEQEVTAKVVDKADQDVQTLFKGQ